ncbi:MAG: hypothetical protein P8Z49_06265 [Acidobacteriota bacterium]
MNILRDFLEHMVDYAGLFPPARLDMKTAFHNYHTYRDSLESWMLGSFIVPFSRLAEMEDEAGDRIGAASEESPFRCSLIAGPRPDAAALGLAAFNGKYRLSGNGAGAVVEAVECKADTIEEIRSLAGLFPEDVAVFVEIPWGKEAGGLIGALAEANLNAKVRTGGIVPDLYPPAAGLLNFIWACHLSGVPFKATAGLHHPVRSRHVPLLRARGRAVRVRVSGGGLHSGGHGPGRSRPPARRDRPFRLRIRRRGWRMAREPPEWGPLAKRSQVRRLLWILFI